MMKVENTKLKGVRVITPPTHFEDFRGEYVEIYNEKLYHEAGVTEKFIQDDISVSRQHVLRGIHGDSETTKLVSCLEGCFYLVVLDNRKDSGTFGQWEAFTLSEKNRLQVLIPAGCGNGHVVMSERAMFHYKQTTQYNRAGQFTIKWNDPQFGIYWPIKAPILSARDEVDSSHAS